MFAGSFSLGRYLDIQLFSHKGFLTTMHVDARAENGLPVVLCGHGATPHLHVSLF